MVTLALPLVAHATSVRNSFTHEFKKASGLAVKVAEDVCGVDRPYAKTAPCMNLQKQNSEPNQDDPKAAWEFSEAIDQNKVTENDFCTGNQAGLERTKYSNGIFSNDLDISINITFQQKGEDKSTRIPVGYDVYTQRIGVGMPYVEEGVEYPADEYPGSQFPKRVWNYEYFGRGKDGNLQVVDSPVREEFKAKKVMERFISTDMRLNEYSFFPRLVVPSIRKREGKIQMKLTTGEEIILDETTGRIIGGVGKEVPAKNPVEKRLDKYGNGNVRTFPDTDFVYTGDALWIEHKVTHNNDEKKPGNLVTAKANVEGKVHECKLKSDHLWVLNWGYYLPQAHERYLSSGWQCTKYKFEKDEELFALIRKTCPAFKFPALVKQGKLSYHHLR